MKQQSYFPVDTCIVCGKIVPEGRHVCQNCMEAAKLEGYRIPFRPAIPAPPSLCQRILSIFR